MGVIVGGTLEQVMAEALRSQVPVPVGCRTHHRDGSIGMFSYRVSGSLCGNLKKFEADILSGKARALELRMDDGSLVIVRRRTGIPYAARRHR